MVSLIAQPTTLRANRSSTDGQIQPAFTRRNVRDVGQPDLVRGSGCELPIKEVRGNRKGVFAVGRSRGPAFVAALDTVTAHQAGDTVDAHPSPLGTQGGMNARTAVDCTVVGVNTADLGGKAAIGDIPGAVRTVPPCIVAAVTDLQHGAHRPHRECRSMVFDEAEPHLGGPEKMPTAFFKMSRSVWARSRSRRRRRISTCSAEGATVAREPAALAIRVTLPFTVPRQLRSIDGWIPNSVAIWVSGRPLDASSDTASRLNSSVNDRRVVAFIVINAPRPFQELTRGVHSFGGGSMRRVGRLRRTSAGA